jgi:hypothetical protein
LIKKNVTVGEESKAKVRNRLLAFGLEDSAVDDYQKGTVDEKKSRGKVRNRCSDFGLRDQRKHK